MHANMSLVKRSESANLPENDLAGALHEVSNALTVVLGWLGEARGQLPPGPVRDALEVAHAHARRGHSVARRAIGGSHASGAGPETEPDPAELSVRSCESVVLDAIRAAAREAEARGVELVHAPAEADACVEAPEAVLQVLVNLLLNAVAFSPRGASVCLTSVVADGRVRFRVSDDGPGVPEEQRTVLFSRGHSMRPGGAGIGLSHSRALAEQHGGQLRLLPSEKGAAFELDWPLSDVPSRTSQRVPDASLSGLEVLVLEDDEAVLTMIQLGLAARGIGVIAASDLEEVRALAKQGKRYDAVLVDLSPIQDAPVEAIEEIRQGDTHLPVILISGSAVATSAELPLSAWVRKPFEISELCTALADVVRPAG